MLKFATILSHFRPGGKKPRNSPGPAVLSEGPKDTGDFFSETFFLPLPQTGRVRKALLPHAIFSGKGVYLRVRAHKGRFNTQFIGARFTPDFQGPDLPRGSGIHGLHPVFRKGGQILFRKGQRFFDPLQQRGPEHGDQLVTQSCDTFKTLLRRGHFLRDFHDRLVLNNLKGRPIPVPGQFIP